MAKNSGVIKKEEVVIRFSGDSGDGMQLTGTLFSDTAALYGNDLSTFPDYPAEIRAPQGTVGGVSGFQVHLGHSEINTPGDYADVLVAMNPAAIRANAGWIKPGGLIIFDKDNFTEKNIEKAYGLITEEFKKLREKPVSKNELNRVKEYLKGSYWMGLESMSNRASRMAHSYINFGRIKNADETIMSIDNVTIEDIQELATRELDEHKMLKIIAGKKNMLAKIDFENNFEEIQI